MPAAAIIYIKYIIDIYHKLVEFFIRPKVILGRETRAGIVLDFLIFLSDWVVDKTRLRLDITSFYNIVRLLVLDDYLLVKEKIKLVRKKFGLIEEILRNN